MFWDVGEGSLCQCRCHEIWCFQPFSFLICWQNPWTIVLSAQYLLWSYIAPNIRHVTEWHVPWWTRAQYLDTCVVCLGHVYIMTHCGGCMYRTLVQSALKFVNPRSIFLVDDDWYKFNKIYPPLPVAAEVWETYHYASILRV